jgi:hypothetical protein
VVILPLSCKIVLQGLFPLAIPQTPRIPYDGITMVDEVGRGKQRTPRLLDRHMGEYQAYVDRGGILTPADMEHTALYEDR